MMQWSWYYPMNASVKPTSLDTLTIPWCLGSATKRRIWLPKLLLSKQQAWIRLKFLHRPLLEAFQIIDLKLFWKLMVMPLHGLWKFNVIGQVNWKYVPTCKHVLQVWWLFLPHMTMRKPKSWTSCLWLTLWHLQFLPRPLRPQLMLWGSSSRAHCCRPLQRLPWKHQLKACQSCLWMVRMGRRWKCLGCLGVFKVPMYN